MNLTTFCSTYNYILLDSLPENWDRYSDGIPSVTTLLSLLYDDKFEMIKKVNPHGLEKAKQKGIATHKNADEFFNGGGKIHHQILKFNILHSFTPVYTEQKIVTDIQGTIDCVGMYGPIGMINLDYKPKTKSHKYKLQLCGYRYLNDLPGGILYLDDRSFTFEMVDTDEYMPAFMELKDLFLTLIK